MSKLCRHITRLIYAAAMALCLCFCANSASAQPNDKQFVDSVLSLITPATPDTTKAHYYHEIAKTVYSSETVIKYANLALECCNPEDTTLRAGCYSCIIWASLMMGKPMDGIKTAKTALALCADNPNQRNAKMVITSMMANCYDDMNRLDSSLLCQTEFIDIANETDNAFMLCFGYQRLAITCLDRKYGEASVEYIDSLESISLRHNMSMHLAFAYSLRSRQKSSSWVDTVDNLVTAVAYIKKAISVYDTISIPSGMLTAYYGVLLSAQELYMRLATQTGNMAYADTSYLYYKKCDKWYTENGLTDFITMQISYADYLMAKKRHAEALRAVKECEPYLQDSMHTLYKQMYHSALANCYYALKDYKKALANRKLALKYMMMVNNEQTSDDISDFKVLTYSKRRKKLDEIERANIELKNQLETRHSRIILFITISGLALLLTIVLFLWRSFALKRKTNNELFVKNSLLSQQREEIEAQRDVLTVQTQNIEKINRRIMASVNYAQRIQHAAMPSDEDLKKIFPDSFVYFCPKSVVSGDFYYATSIDGCRVIILADCTGHGIPGGFLSMLGIFGLKEFVRTKEDALNPAAILDKMKAFVINSLSSEKNHYAMNDGMDMTVCTILPDNKVMKYASANQSVVLIQNGAIIRMLGDKMPVAKYLDSNEKFSTYETAINAGDTLYMFTDGIPDQLGGYEEGKNRRLLKITFEAYLLELSAHPIDQQYVLFEKFINNWQGGRIQTDDQSLIGIRI